MSRMAAAHRQYGAASRRLSRLGLQAGDAKTDLFGYASRWFGFDRTRTREETKEVAFRFSGCGPKAGEESTSQLSAGVDSDRESTGCDCFVAVARRTC